MKNTEMTNSFLGKNSGKKVTVYLVNGIKLEGELLNHDDVGIEMTSKDSQDAQLVLRSAISTIKPN
jgi:RNA chaperone Hfq